VNNIVHNHAPTEAIYKILVKTMNNIFLTDFCIHFLRKLDLIYSQRFGTNLCTLPHILPYFYRINQGILISDSSLHIK
jgi:hypothetical protein